MAITELSLDETPQTDGLHQQADHAFAIVTGYIDNQPLESGLTLLTGYRNQFDALEAQILATNIKQNGASNRNNEALLGKGSKRTKRENKKRASRANAVNKNPRLGDDLAKGSLGVEQLDAIAHGSDKTNGAAAKDQKLIDDVKNANPDKANAIVRDWVDDYKSPGEHETLRSRLRRLRKVTNFWTDRGTKALLIEGDDQSIDEMAAVMEQGAEDLYHKDGGRDALFPASLPQARSVAHTPTV